MFLLVFPQGLGDIKSLIAILFWHFSDHPISGAGMFYYIALRHTPSSKNILKIWTICCVRFIKIFASSYGRVVVDRAIACIGLFSMHSALEVCFQAEVKWFQSYMQSSLEWAQLCDGGKPVGFTVLTFHWKVCPSWWWFSCMQTGRRTFADVSNVCTVHYVRILASPIASTDMIICRTKWVYSYLLTCRIRF